MLATLGHVVLWTLAVFGFIVMCGIIGSVHDDKKKAKLTPPTSTTQRQIDAPPAIESEPAPEPNPVLLHRVVIPQERVKRYRG